MVRLFKPVEFERENERGIEKKGKKKRETNRRKKRERQRERESDRKHFVVRLFKAVELFRADNLYMFRKRERELWEKKEKR